MAEPGMPTAVSDAVADFVEQRCLTRLGRPGATDEVALARLKLVGDYRAARRQGRGMTADNLALAILDSARPWRDDPAFDPAWRRWITPDSSVPPGPDSVQPAVDVR